VLHFLHWCYTFCTVLHLNCIPLSQSELSNFFMRIINSIIRNTPIMYGVLGRQEDLRILEIWVWSFKTETSPMVFIFNLCWIRDDFWEINYREISWSNIEMWGIKCFSCLQWSAWTFQTTGSAILNNWMCCLTSKRCSASGLNFWYLI